MRTLSEFSGAPGMVDAYTSERLSVVTKVRRFEGRWKEVAHRLRNGGLTPGQYLDFEIPFLKSTLEKVTGLSGIAEATRNFAGVSFFLKRTGLPTLVLSIDDSGMFHVEPANEGEPPKSMPGIEFAGTDLFIEGILGLSSRESYVKAYISGGIKIYELHRFRKWAPYVLAKLLKVDRSDYQAIVHGSITKFINTRRN